MYKCKVIDNTLNVYSGWNRNKNSIRGLRFNTEKWIIAHIENAKEIVCIATFLLADENIVRAIENAINTGVRVYLLIASENTLEKDYELEGDFSKKCINSHIILLSRLSGRAFIRSSRINHAKFVFIDPFTDNAKGLISTGNFTEEGVAGRNEELHHELDINEVNTLARYFKHAFWNCAEHEMFSGLFKQADKLKIPVDLSLTSDQTIVSSLDGDSSLHDACLNLVKKASKSLIVAAFGFDKDNDIVKEIAQKSEKGVKVIVLSRIRPKNKEAMKMLRMAGVTIYGFQYLHAKCIIADESEAIMMTANFEDLSFKKSFEVGSLLKRKEDVDVFLQVLNDWIDKAGWVFCLHAKLIDLNGFFINIDASNFYEQKEIVEFTQFECGSYLPSLDLIENFEPNEEIKKKELTLSEKCMYCKVVYNWQCESPHLEYGSVEIRKKRECPVVDDELHGSVYPPKKRIVEESYNPKIFREPSGRRVIAIRDDSELKNAIELKKKMRCEAIVYET